MELLVIKKKKKEMVQELPNQKYQILFRVPVETSLQQLLFSFIYIV